jgi:hypothetical protein
MYVQHVTNVKKIPNLNGWKKKIHHVKINWFFEKKKIINSYSDEIDSRLQY